MERGGGGDKGNFHGEFSVGWQRVIYPRVSRVRQA
jgi:hypothetical protein